jgi:hypothetical protein
MNLRRFSVVGVLVVAVVAVAFGFFAAGWNWLKLSGRPKAGSIVHVPVGEYGSSSGESKWWYLPDKIELTPEKYNVKAMMAYEGPSFREDEPIPLRAPLFMLHGTENTIRGVDILLSSQGIRYNVSMSNPSGYAGFGGLPQDTLHVSVPADRCQEAMSIIQAGVKAGVLEEVKLPESEPVQKQRWYWEGGAPEE